MFVHITEPQTRAGPPPSPLPFPSLLPFPSSCFFLHQLQTSITQSFVKLEHFLRPFLKTRSHDGSAHTFGIFFLQIHKNSI